MRNRRVLHRIVLCLTMAFTLGVSTVGAVAAAPQPGKSAMPLYDGPSLGFPDELYRLPVAGDRIPVSAGPGCAGHVGPYSGNIRAIDLAVREQPLYNPGREPARVSKSYWEDMGGWIVYLEHPNGLTTLYAHLREQGPAVDTWIEPGAQFATSGNTGSFNGVQVGFHVHFSALRNEVATDITGAPTIEWNPLLNWSDGIIQNCGDPGVSGENDGYAWGAPPETQAAPPAPSCAEQPLEIVEPLRIEPGSPMAGEPISATFTVRNTRPIECPPFTASRIGVGGRGPGETGADFPLYETVTIQPQDVWTYYGTQAYSPGGQYRFFIFQQNLGFANPYGLTAEVTIQVNDRPAEAEPPPAPEQQTPLPEESWDAEDPNEPSDGQAIMPDGSGSDFAEPSSPPDAVTQPTTIDLVSLLPTLGEVPGGLTETGRRARSLDEMTPYYLDPQATSQSFTAWGFQGNAIASFANNSARDGEVNGVYVSITQFGSPGYAQSALDFSIQELITELSVSPIAVSPMGEYSQGLFGTFDYGYEVTIYVQQGDLLIRVSVAIRGSDPTADAEAIMRTILARTTGYASSQATQSNQVWTQDQSQNQSQNQPQPAAPTSDQSPASLSVFAGTWVGHMEQDNPESDWSVAIILLDGGSGSAIGYANYTSLTCGGLLYVQQINGNSIVLAEHLTYGQGRCLDGGTMTLTLRSDGSLDFAYSGTLSNGSLSTAWGTLTRN